MKTKIAMSAMVVALMATVSLADTIIYSETFDGDGSGKMDGRTTTTGGGTWDSFSDFMQNNGVSAGGAGSMLLPFAPELNKQYTLSMDVTHGSVANRYISLGFSRYGIDRTKAATGNRPSNTGGLAWIQYGNNATAPFVTYEGEGQSSVIANTGTYVTTKVNLMVKIDTTGDGSSFTAEFFAGGASVSDITTINRSVDHLNYVGIGSQGDPTAGVVVDNFELSVIPEPATFGLVAVFGGAALFIRRRTMK